MNRCFVGLGADPAPGDPDELAGIARVCLRAAADLGTTVQRLRQLAAAGPCWDGSARRAWEAAASARVPVLEQAAGALAEAGRRLGAHADLLHDAQARAWQLELAADSARRGLPDPSAEQELRRALSQARVLREDVRGSATAAAHVLDAAAASCHPAGQPALLRLADVVADAVTESVPRLASEADVHVGDWVRGNAASIKLGSDILGLASGAVVLSGVGAPVAAALGGVALTGHASLARYADGSSTDIILGAAGMATMGVSAGAVGLARTARRAEGLPVPDKGLPSVLLRSTRVAAGEMPWRTVKAGSDGVGAGSTAVAVPPVTSSLTARRDGRRGVAAPHLTSAVAGPVVFLPLTVAPAVPLGFRPAPGPLVPAPASGPPAPDPLVNDPSAAGPPVLGPPAGDLAEGGR